jgi:hypothetical protein
MAGIHHGADCKPIACAANNGQYGRMFWRWIIRSFCLALSVICVGLWVTSFGSLIFVNYSGKTWNRAFVADGKIGFIGDNPLPAQFEGWSHGYADDRDFVVRDGRAKHHFLGFSYDRGPFDWYVAIPVYFPTLLSALLLWFVWRKTRAKGTGVGFPIEPSAKAT